MVAALHEQHLELELLEGCSKADLQYAFVGLLSPKVYLWRQKAGPKAFATPLFQQRSKSELSSQL